MSRYCRAFVISAFYMAGNNVLQGVLLRYSSKTHIKIHYSEKKTNLDVDFAQKLYIIVSRKEGEVAIMLIQFNFKNFKSFRDEATLDLSASKMTEFSDRVVTVGSEKILPVAAIYGANASGKSNIYNAFEYMSDYVADSFKYGDEEEKFEEFRPTPFLFDSTSASAESSFEVYFTLPGDKAERTYNYGFCIDKEGVTEEWLNSKAKSARKYSTVFYRGTSDDELDLSGFPKSSRDNIQVALEKQVLIISLGAKLKVGKCKAIRDWFLANEFADFVDEAGSRIRKDESYEKNYLIGKYGAIPTLKSIDIFKEDCDLKINRIKIIKSIGLKKICWIRFVKSVGLE